MTSHFGHQGAAWRRLAHYGAARGPLWWVRGSPPLFGLLACAFLPRERGQVRQNIRSLLGPRSRLRESLDVAATFVHFAQTLTEQLGVERPEARAASCIVQEGVGFPSSLDAHAGFVVVTAHTAAWEIAARALVTDANRPVVLAMEAEPDIEARRLHERLRETGAVRVVYTGRDELSSLSLLGHLRQGGIVAMQLDRASPAGRVLEIPLGTSTLSVPLGPFVLAAAAGVPLVPLFVVRRGHFQYRVTFGEIERLPRRPNAEQFRDCALRVGAALREHLLAHPTHWFHFVDQ
jgi:phosphatidylinositol dimannoside acyltransferase